MYHFIINVSSKSGRGIRIWTTIKDELNAKGIEYLCYFTKYKGHAHELATQICTENDGIKTLIVLGGDGTLNEVLNGITNLDEVILGYIPTGSSNDFARSLKLPKDPLECLKRILYPNRFDFLDIGEVTTEDKVTSRFCVSSGIGFDAAICEETFHSPLKKTLNKLGLGKLTYIIICVKQVFSSKTMNGYITKEDGTTVPYKNILLVTSMIQKYQGGGVLMCPGADPRDGLLSICFVHGLSKFKILGILPILNLGKHAKFKGVELFHCKRLKVQIENPSYLHHDGECPGKYTTFELKCLHKKLRIIV